MYLKDWESATRATVQSNWHNTETVERKMELWTKLNCALLERAGEWVHRLRYIFLRAGRENVAEHMIHTVLSCVAKEVRSVAIAKEVVAFLSGRPNVSRQRVRVCVRHAFLWLNLFLRKWISPELWEFHVRVSYRYPCDSCAASTYCLLNE